MTGRCAIFLAITTVVLAQMPRPTFEVASVKENIATPGPPVWTPERSGDRVILRKVRLDVMINYAWNIDHLYQVAFPNNMPSEWWDVEAKSDTIPDDDRLRLMFRTLLEDRFKVKAHFEMRDLQQYDLVVSKPGKLNPADPESPMKVSGRSLRPGIAAILNEEDGQHLISSGCTLAQIADSLSRSLRAPVRDRTGLVGTWDFNGLLDEDLNLPSTVERELGLKLQQTKAPLRVLVVDHAEKPAPN